MRAAAIPLLLFLMAGCAGGRPQSGGRLAKVHYLSAIEAVPAPMRTGASGAPIEGLIVSGTITNDGKAPLTCSPGEFVLVRAGSGDVSPSSEFCALPSIAPNQSTYFNATFAAAPRDDLQSAFRARRRLV